MTQNSWPQDGGLESPDTDSSFPNRPAAAFDPAVTPAVSDSQKVAGANSQTAKDETGNLVEHTKDAAHNVMDSVKDEAANVTADAKVNARDLLEQAKLDLTEQAGTQQQKVAEGLRSVSDELHSLVSGSGQSGMATDLVSQAAERASSVASGCSRRAN